MPLLLPWPRRRSHARKSVDKYLYSTEPNTEVTGEGGVFSGDGEETTAQRQDAAEIAAQEAAIRDDASGASTLAVVAATLLLAGLGLFALRWTSRRLGDGYATRISGRGGRAVTLLLSPRSSSARRGRPLRRDPEACRWNA